MLTPNTNQTPASGATPNQALPNVVTVYADPKQPYNNTAGAICVRLNKQPPKLATGDVAAALRFAANLADLNRAMVLIVPGQVNKIALEQAPDAKGNFLTAQQASAYADLLAPTPGNTETEQALNQELDALLASADPAELVASAPAVGVVTSQPSPATVLATPEGDVATAGSKSPAKAPAAKGPNFEDGV